MPNIAPTACTVRPATPADLPEIARLIVQLYDTELPGALVGPPEKKQALMRFTLEANGEAALRQRYMLCAADGQVAGTGMLQFPGDPTFERAPAGTVRKATALLGVRYSARLLFTAAKTLLTVYKQRNPAAALVHSVVVDEQFRGHGLGRMLMGELERTAAGHGYRSTVLQVLADNVSARTLYLHMGYRDIWQSPAWTRHFTWATHVMQKELSAG